MKAAPLRLRVRHHRGRRTVVLLLAACWALGFFGLEGGRISLRFSLLAGFGLVVWVLSSARRRKTEAARAALVGRASEFPRPAVIVRRYGQNGDRRLIG